MIPRGPSEPIIRFRREYPEEVLETVAPKRVISPVGSTTVMARTYGSVLLDTIDLTASFYPAEARAQDARIVRLAQELGFAGNAKRRLFVIIRTNGLRFEIHP